MQKSKPSFFDVFKKRGIGEIKNWLSRFNPFPVGLLLSNMELQIGYLGI